jgi:hypothetical protein
VCRESPFDGSQQFIRGRRLHPGLCEGFHEDEGPGRWTDGMGLLPEALLFPFAGALTIEVHRLAVQLRYPTRAATHQLPNRAPRIAEADAVSIAVGSAQGA